MSELHCSDLVKRGAFRCRCWVTASQERVSRAVSARTDALRVLETFYEGDVLRQWGEGIHRFPKVHLAISHCWVPAPVSVQGKTMPHI